jgi:uncharacterized HAD superfamily protein/adenine/guanine phosphoribosyltransferase-like PRPP-binding protein
LNYRSIQQLSIDLLTWQLPSDIELIVGIPRSGLLAANLLAVHRNVPFTDLEGFLQGRTFSVGVTKKGDKNTAQFLEKPRSVLVLDDSCLTGNEIKRARRSIETASLAHRVRFGVVYLSPGHEGEVDCYRCVLPVPRIFEWNLVHSALAAQGCWDIDGVLCRDPTAKENDDGLNYVKFILGVPPLLCPSFPLAYVVTSRLEKYRRHTEAWLAKNGIQYEQLIMLDLPDKESRLAAGCHASFKARVYRNAPARIFIESSYRQALEIAHLSGKPVICIETQECIAPSAHAEVILEYRNLIRTVRDRFRGHKVRLKKRLKRRLGFDVGPRPSM